MKFNKGAVNADTTPVAISTHTLFCQDNGIFGFTQNGITTTVTEITCSELKKCATCKLSQLSLTTDPESGVSPAPTNPIPGSNGCTEMTVTCNFGEAFTGSMKFNQGAVNADAAPVGVSTHTLICQKDGTFGFTQNGVTTTVTEVACKKTATIKCDSSYITQETTFTAPQYINVQPNGDITARCEDPLAITIGQYITDEPDTSGTTLIDTPLYCNPTTGKYSIVPNFPTPVTRVQCCSFRCPLLTYTGGSMTYDLSNDGCPVGVIRCNANTGPVTLSVCFF
uniref:Uncharacterized protein n=1 Tax=Panagrolaimus davidi TaxID=227884 RepID=A0A914P1H8_9BILA